MAAWPAPLGRIIAAGLVAALSAWPVRAGEVLVLSGDTLVLDGTPIRLSGVTAPGRREACTRDGRPFPCGLQSAARLEALVAGREVRCEGLEGPRIGQVVVATCWAGAVDLGGELVRQGWAFADRRYSTRYLGDEARAREQRRGLWAGELGPPEP